LTEQPIVLDVFIADREDLLFLLISLDFRGNLV